MKEKISVAYRPDKQIIVVDGKTYVQDKTKFKKIDGQPHIDRLTFKEVNEEDHDKLIRNIVAKIKANVSKEEMLYEVFKDISRDTLLKLNKTLNKKGIKIKKQRGCLGLLIIDPSKKKRNRTYIRLFD